MSGQGPAKTDNRDGAIRVVVADDEETVVDVLRALVGSDPTLRYVGGAHDAEQAIDLVRRERPDVVLLDVRMPAGGGLRAAREISKRFPPTRIVALSAHEDPYTVTGIIGAGAIGYVPKSGSTDRILRSIHRAVGRGSSMTRTGVVQPTTTSPRDGRAALVARAIIDGIVTAEFAPIVDLRSGRIAGFEVQPRIATLPLRSYDAWCADAQAVGLLADLELAAFRAGRTALRHVADDAFLEFEVSPFTASEARFRRTIQRSFASRIVLGFSPLVASGRIAVKDASFGEKLRELRGRGVRIAARDAGTGPEGLDHLASLAPEYVRLDERLSRDVEGRFSNHAIVAAVAACARQVGAEVIATGVATPGQVAEIDALGIDLVQGPLAGEPMTASELADPGGATTGGVSSSRDTVADDGKGNVPAIEQTPPR